MGGEAKAPRSRGKAWKDMNERRRRDELMAKGGLNVSSLLYIVLQAFLRISTPVSSLRQTHIHTLFSPNPAEQLPLPEVTGQTQK